MAAMKQASVSEKAATGGMPTPKPPPPPINERAFDRFLKLTGYKREEVLSSSPKNYTFVTSNGGKYQMNKKGTQIRVLSGPEPVKPRKTEPEDFEENGGPPEEEEEG